MVKKLGLVYIERGSKNGDQKADLLKVKPTTNDYYGRSKKRNGVVIFRKNMKG